MTARKDSMDTHEKTKIAVTLQDAMSKWGAPQTDWSTDLLSNHAEAWWQIVNLVAAKKWEWIKESPTPGYVHPADWDPVGGGDWVLFRAGGPEFRHTNLDGMFWAMLSCIAQAVEALVLKLD